MASPRRWYVTIGTHTGALHVIDGFPTELAALLYAHAFIERLAVPFHVELEPDQQ